MTLACGNFDWQCINWNFSFSSQRAPTIHLSVLSVTLFSLRRGPVARDRIPSALTRVQRTACHGLPLRFAPRRLAGQLPTTGGTLRELAGDLSRFFHIACIRIVLRRVLKKLLGRNPHFVW